MLTLQATTREATADLAVLRAADAIPAVFYGQGKDATLITVPRREFIKLYQEAGESTIITLQTESGDYDVLVQEIQLNAATHELLHVDFKTIEAGQSITVTVPLEFVGVAPAEENGLGVIVKSVQEVEIEVMPKDLPHSLEVDLSVLVDLSANIYARDIKIPAGSELLLDPETVIASATAVEEEPDDAPAEEVDFSQIAVEKKGKEEAAEDTAE